MYYPCNENKGADQLHSSSTVDLRLCFTHANSRFSHEVAHVFFYFMITDVLNTFVAHTVTSLFLFSYVYTLQELWLLRVIGDSLMHWELRGHSLKD